MEKTFTLGELKKTLRPLSTILSDHDSCSNDDNNDNNDDYDEDNSYEKT